MTVPLAKATAMILRSIARVLPVLFATACAANAEPAGPSEGTQGAEAPSPVPQSRGAHSAVAYEYRLEVREGLRVGGQPSVEELEAAAAAGVTTVITLRTDDEPGAEGERARVEGLGMRFVSIPVEDAEDLTEAKARQLDQALDGAGRPVLLHCGSANRAGALLGLRAFVTEGATADEAMAIAHGAGMTRMAEPLEATLRRLCAGEAARCPGAQDEVDESEDLVPTGPAPE